MVRNLKKMLKKELEEQRAQMHKPQMDAIAKANDAAKKHLGKDQYTIEDLKYFYYRSSFNAE
jgi:hypothetical protein